MKTTQQRIIVVTEHGTAGLQAPAAASSTVQITAAESSATGRGSTSHAVHWHAVRNWAIGAAAEMLSCS